MPTAADRADAGAADSPADVARLVSLMRETGPLVHCLTNSVVRQITADVLLAAGAAHAMVDHPDEAGDFAAIARLNPARDASGITVIGDTPRVYSSDASGVVVTDTDRVIALIGIEDVVVVDTGDALLVTTTEHAQDVKKAVESLKARGADDVL